MIKLKKSTVSYGLFTAIVIGIAMLASLFIVGCTNKSQQQFKDSGRSGNDRGPAKTVEMPDGFNNIAYKCLAGTDVLAAVTFHGDSKYGAVSMVVDPTDCKP